MNSHKINLFHFRKRIKAKALYLHFSKDLNGSNQDQKKKSNTNAIRKRHLKNDFMYHPMSTYWKSQLVFTHCSLSARLSVMQIVYIYIFYFWILCVINAGNLNHNYGLQVYWYTRKKRWRVKCEIAEEAKNKRDVTCQGKRCDAMTR